MTRASAAAARSRSAGECGGSRRTPPESQSIHVARRSSGRPSRDTRRPPSGRSHRARFLEHDPPLWRGRFIGERRGGRHREQRLVRRSTPSPRPMTGTIRGRAPRASAPAAGPCRAPPPIVLLSAMSSGPAQTVAIASSSVSMVAMSASGSSRDAIDDVDDERVRSMCRRNPLQGQPRARALDQAGDIRDDELALVEARDSQIRRQSGEGVSGDLRVPRA